MSRIDRQIFDEAHGDLDLAWNYEAGYLNPYTREVFDAWLENKARDDRRQEDLWSIESANKLAAINGPMHELGVCWLLNGPDGATFPEELIRVGFHIMHPERIPDSLLQKLDQQHPAEGA